MNPKILFVLLLTTVTFIAAGQDNKPLNQSDAKGLKQGHWIRKTPKGHIQYDGYFKDNLPVGPFKRYYENDSLSSVLVYSADSKSADATFYYQNGFIESKGKYVNQKKEGKWKFFSAVKADYLLCEEDYLHNLKNGLSVKYYPDKTPSEKLSYVNDVKSGEWYQYFPNGQVCLKATYTDGQLNGKFTLYYNNGKPEFTGQYNNDSRDGNWIRYNIDGSLKKAISYVNGQITDPELNKEDTDYLDALEKNKGMIEDPEKTGTIFQQ